MSMTEHVPTPELLDRLGMSPEASAEPAAGGASASAWRINAGGETFMLRRSSAQLAGARLSAMEAARRAGLPAPELLARGHWDDAEALLLSWLPGTPMLHRLTAEPAAAVRLGRLMGEAQRGLHEVEAPLEVAAALEDDSHPFGAGRDVTGLPDGNRLLHLDWHPLNLLVDERDRLVGIIDWDNARRGHPLLDLARTESVLTVDPTLESLPRSLRGKLARFRGAWAEGYGDDARRIPAVARRWASRVMRDDLALRHADAPETLRRIREWGNASEQPGG